MNEQQSRQIPQQGQVPQQGQPIPQQSQQIPHPPQNTMPTMVEMQTMLGLEEPKNSVAIVLQIVAFVALGLGVLGGLYTAAMTTEAANFFSGMVVGVFGCVLFYGMSELVTLLQKILNRMS